MFVTCEVSHKTGRAKSSSSAVFISISVPFLQGSEIDIRRAAIDRDPGHERVETQKVSRRPRGFSDALKTEGVLAGGQFVRPNLVSGRRYIRRIEVYSSNVLPIQFDLIITVIPGMDHPHAEIGSLLFVD